MKIAVVGAQGSGKSSLIDALQKLLPENCVLTDAPAWLHGVDLILLMGLDLPWTPDQAAREPSQKREQVDARLRSALTERGVPFVVVYGLGAVRTEAARQAIAHHARQPELRLPQKSTPWQWNCEKCSDGSCEHSIFTALLKTPPSGRPTATDQWTVGGAPAKSLPG